MSAEKQILNSLIKSQEKEIVDLKKQIAHLKTMLPVKEPIVIETPRMVIEDDTQEAVEAELVDGSKIEFNKREAEDLLEDIFGRKEEDEGTDRE